MRIGRDIDRDKDSYRDRDREIKQLEGDGERLKETKKDGGLWREMRYEDRWREIVS